MTDNITIKDSSLVDRIVKTRDRGSVHTQITEQEKVTSYTNLDLDETGVSVLGSAALLHNWEVFNDDVDPLYVKLYNKASAPTSGDTPIRVWEIMPGNAPFLGSVENGIDFPLGLGLRCTKGRAHNDATAPATNACLINLGYRAG